MIVFTYATYITLSIALTVWVAQTLFKNGKIFLIDVFAGDEPLANSVNHLLVVGFYLVNFGFVSLFLKIEGEIADARLSIEALALKLGTVLLVLGAMHFVNLAIFTKVRAQQVATRQKEEWLKTQRTVPPVVR